MAGKELVVLYPERLKQSRTLLTGITKADRFRNGITWYSLVDIQHGQVADAVEHFGRHLFEVGDVVTIYSVDSHPVMTVQLTAICLLEIERLNDEDWQHLGFLNRLDYEQTTLGNHRVWAFDFEPVNAQARQTNDIQH